MFELEKTFSKAFKRKFTGRYGLPNRLVSSKLLKPWYKLGKRSYKLGKLFCKEFTSKKNFLGRIAFVRDCVSSLFAAMFVLLCSLFFRIEIWLMEDNVKKLSHFIEGMEYQLRLFETSTSDRKVIKFVFWPLEYPNEFLGKRYQKVVTWIFRTPYLILFINLLNSEPFLKKILQKRLKFMKRVVNRQKLEQLEVFDRGSVSIKFSRRQINRGKKLEKDLFGECDSEFVVFAHTSVNYRKQIDVALHRGDNLLAKVVDSNAFEMLILDLRRKGLGVVRQGLFLDENPILTRAGLVIPNETQLSPGFADVWLSSRCKLLVTAHTGAYFFTEAFNKPWVMTDAHTFAYPNWSSRGAVIFCLCWMEDEKRFASFQWMKENERWCFDKEKVGRTWKIVPNTPEQIVEVVNEKLARLDGSWVSTKEDEDLQRRFQRFVFGEVKDYSFLPRAGTKFLRDYQHLLPD